MVCQLHQLQRFEEAHQDSSRREAGWKDSRTCAYVEGWPLADIEICCADIWCKVFLFALDRNIETVDTFFNKRLADAQRRLTSLRSRYEDHFDLSPASENISTNGSVHSEDFGSDTATRTPDCYGLDRDEMEEILGALLELRSMLRKIQWYAEVNRRGFIKILKK